MRIHLNRVALAALAVPACSFQIVLMSNNYLQSLGGGKLVRKAPWKPSQQALPASSGTFPPPQQQVQAAPVQQIPTAPVSNKEVQAYAEEPVMQAMSELTETFIQNEAATLLALKEISSSMKLLAKQGGISGFIPLPPATPGPPEPQAIASSPRAVVLPPPVPAVRTRDEVVAAVASKPPPATPAPISKGEPGTKPPVVFSGASAWGTMPSAGGSYLDNISAKPGPLKPATYMPKMKNLPKVASSSGTGSYMDGVATVPNPFAAPASSAVPPLPTSPPASTPPANIPDVTTLPPPTPPAPVGGEGANNVGVATSLSFTIFGIGLLLALAGGGMDYVQNQFNFPSLSQEEEALAPESLATDTVTKPSAAAPDSPVAPEEAVPDDDEIPVPEERVPSQGIMERILGAMLPEPAQEAVPAPELAAPGAVPDEAQIPVPENPAPVPSIIENILGIPKAMEEGAQTPEMAAPEPEVASPEPELAAPEPEVAAPVPEIPPTPAQVPEVATLEPETATPEPEVKAPEPEMATQEPELTAQEPDAPPGFAERLRENIMGAFTPQAPSIPDAPPVPLIPPVVSGSAGAAAGAMSGMAATGAAAAAPGKIGSTYSYDPSAINGPTRWSMLQVEGNECGGKKQSPIAITPTGCKVGGNYKMETTSTCSVSDLDYSLGRGGPKAAFPKQCGGSTIQIPLLEGVYEAVQFHTHIGSEHVIGGKRAGAELHIVHKEQEGNRFAVVGIMINGDGAVDHPTFGRLLDKWAAIEKEIAGDCNGAPTPTKNRPLVSDSTFNVYDLIPLGTSFYHYDGSLTTPPCSEVVWWEVADTPLSVSPAQLDRLVKMTTTFTDPSTCELQTAASPLDGSTNRPVAQDLAGREVQRVCPVLEAQQTLVSSMDGTLIAAKSPAATEQTVQTLLASAMNRPFADDYDPYAGM